jgi:hypothetical protein
MGCHELQFACRQHETKETQYFGTESFNKKIGEKVSPLGMPSQQHFNNKRDERDSDCL